MYGVASVSGCELVRGAPLLEKWCSLIEYQINPDHKLQLELELNYNALSV